VFRKEATPFLYHAIWQGPHVNCTIVIEQFSYFILAERGLTKCTHSNTAA